MLIFGVGLLVCCKEGIVNYLGFFYYILRSEKLFSMIQSFKLCGDEFKRDVGVVWEII